MYISRYFASLTKSAYKASSPNFLPTKQPNQIRLDSFYRQIIEYFRLSLSLSVSVCVSQSQICRLWGTRIHTKVENFSFVVTTMSEILRLPIHYISNPELKNSIWYTSEKYVYVELEYGGTFRIIEYTISFGEWENFGKEWIMSKT